MEEYDTEELGEMLQNRVYMLKSYYEKRKSLAERLNLPNLKINFPLAKEGNVVQNIIDLSLIHI